MRHLSLGSLPAVSLLTVVAMIGLVGPLPAIGQPSSSTTFQTPWGEPDLQGIWANDVSTPLERPDRFGGKTELNQEELASYTVEQQASRENRDLRESDPGAVTDVGRAYNALWFPVPGNPIERTSLIVDPPNGRMPALTTQARERYAVWAEGMGLFNSGADPRGNLWNGGWDPDMVALDGTEGGVDGRGSRADNPEDRRFGERCIMNYLPRFPGGYNNHFQIVQSPGYVVIEHEMQHHVRVIPVDGSSHLPQDVQQWMGDSRARWEGDVLVVDTTNFTDKAPFKGSFDGLHLVEKFRRVDANTIDYEVTLSDPATWESPWTVAYPLRALQSLMNGVDGMHIPQMFEYACHEGNYGLLGQLSGSRAVEQAENTNSR